MNLDLSPGKWQVYLVRCADDTLYCGVTLDVIRRIAEHDAGKGAKYTRGRGPVKLLAVSVPLNQSAAQRLESAIKRLPAEKKLETIRQYQGDPEMWSLATLERINLEAERKSMEKGSKPYVFKRKDEVDEMPPFPFPWIGRRQVDGWEFDHQEWFVDKTGVDTGGGFALTVDGFKRTLREFMQNIPHTEMRTFGYGIVEEGPMQLKIGLFRRKGRGFQAKEPSA